MIPRISHTLKFLLFGGCLLICLPQVSYCTTGDELLTQSESRRPAYSRRTPTRHYDEERPNPENEENEYFESGGGGGGRNNDNPPLSQQHLSAQPSYNEYAPQSDGHRDANVGFMRHQDVAPPKGFPSFDEIQAHFQQTSASSSRNQLRNGGGGGPPRRPPPQFEYNDAEGPPGFNFGGPPPPQFLGRAPPQALGRQRPYFQRRPPTSDNYNEGPNAYYNEQPEGRGYPNDEDDVADNSNIPEVQPYPVVEDDAVPQNHHHHRTRRSSNDHDDDDMLADGMDNIESLWQPAPPPPQQQQASSSSSSPSSSSYILFDRYKKHGEESVEQRSSPSSSNVTFHDSNSEEQRFFPSFPSPYLTGLSPFGLSNALSASPITGGIGGRAPLFPGPSSSTNNRAPSRYHPSSNAPSFKFGGISSPLSNRGPSSAASHGHDRYREHDNNLLGSGNFEVIRGGTYYGEDDEGPSYHHHGHHQAASPYRDEDDGYYSQNNGHSSPYHMGGGGGDFFANFRDFADINPHSRSYSHQTETHVDHVGRPRGSAEQNNNNRRTSLSDELLQTASSRHNNNKPQFSLEYDPMMATF